MRRPPVRRLRVLIHAVVVGLACIAPQPSSAQCAGDCNADGHATVDELVTMINVALGDASVLACPVGDASLDGDTTVDEITAAIDAALSGCTLRRSFDFRAGRQGWEADFADYAPEMVEGLELDAGPRTLPPELGLQGPGFLLSGFNQSDDLYMSLSRRLTAADGIEPERAYSVELSIVFASAAPSGCPGIGGAPGESVFMKAGAAPIEPEPFLDSTDGHVRMNIDKGNQSEGGLHASVFGDAANGLPCEPGSEMFVSLRREHRHLPAVSASAAGDLWLLVGSDSGFEGTTSLYYQRIEVKLTPVDELQ
jgi:hypothetical protein